jgi:hypothetical protein
MNLALLLLLPAGAAVDIAPTLTAASAITADTYNAFVATEETPPVEKLIVPAVLKDEARKATFALDARSIA